MFLRRLAIIALTLPLAVVATWDAALGYQVAQADGGIALILAPAPQLRVQRNEQLALKPEEITSHADSIRRDALAALAAEPLDPIALRHLGMIEGLAQGDAGAKQFLMAERISRRDLANELVLIELSAHDGKVASTLEHYDRALLAHPDSSSTLFPVLANALVEPEIRQTLAEFARRPWFSEFLGSALANGGDVDSVMSLYMQVQQRMPRDAADNIRAGLLSQLLARKQYATARVLIRSFSGGFTESNEKIGFSPDEIDSRLKPISWTIRSDSSAYVTVNSNDSIDIHVSSERRTSIAERVTLLAPGTYTLTHQLGYNPNTSHAKLSWEIRCLNGAADVPILQIELPTLDGRHHYQTQFTVPAECDAQAWNLIGTADMTQSESTAHLSHLSLSRQ